MIIGNGDIGSVLLPFDKPDWLFFASGVSNSQETDEKEYSREKDLLLQRDRTSHVVYFSTLSVFYGTSRYVQHKRFMERLIQDNFKSYTIIRIGNIAWGSNPYTIINSLRYKIEKKEKFEIKNEYRYIVEKEEFLHWIHLIPDWNCEINIPGRMMTVKELIEKYCIIDQEMTINKYANS